MAKEESMQVAFIGLGTMGQSMAINILKGGYSLVVHNRTRKREEALAQAGAKRAESPRDAAREADVIITCVSNTEDVEEVLLGSHGAALGAKPGSIVVDMSTINPSDTRRISERLSDRKVHMIDAPVSGGSEGADKGTLAIMMGGEEEDITQVRPLLETMGSTLTHVGPIGSGQLCKAINQITLAGTYWSLSEGIILGLKAGLDMDKVLSAIKNGAAGSWVLNNRASNICKNDYPLGFRLSLHQKDLGIALSVAKELGVAMPVAQHIHEAETELMQAGYGDEDMSVMARKLRK